MSKIDPTTITSGNLSVEQMNQIEGVCSEPPAVTKGFVFQQTMLRIKDPKVSLDFYTRVLGMTLLGVLPFPTMKFTLYFLGYEAKVRGADACTCYTNTYADT